MSSRSPKLHLETLSNSSKSWIEYRDIEDQLMDPVSKNEQPSFYLYKLVVGVIGNFIARSEDPILKVIWVIEGVAHTATRFTFDNKMGYKSVLTVQDLVKPSIKFCWWKPGLYAVSCYITTHKGTRQVTHSFDVSAPEIVACNHITGIVGVGPYKGKEFLRLAYSHEQFENDGMFLSMVMNASQRVGGQVAAIQLASNQRLCTTVDHKSYKLSTNGVYVLDVGMTNTVFYQNHMIDLPLGSENVIFDANDGPGAQLDHKIINAMFIGDGEVFPAIGERYKFYVMFRANVEGAIWVPLLLVDWGWEGYTTFDRETLSWTTAQDPAIMVPMQSIPDDFPTWGQNTEDSKWVLI